MSRVYDVIVAGAGPSGLHFSRNLASEGFEVLLLEEKEDITKNVLCSGIVGEELFENFDIPRELILREISTVRLISPSGAVSIYKHPFPFAYVTDRDKFNAYLFKKAIDCGVEIRLSHRVIDAETTGNGVEVKAFNFKDDRLETFKGKVLILATGMKVRLSKKLGLGYPVNFFKSAQKTIKLNWDYVTIITGSRFSKGGFAWIAPERDGFAKVGLITEGDAREGFENLLETYLPQENKQGVRFKLIVQGPLSKTFGERVISVGECAGHIKSTTGGGIYYGLISSEIASEVILKAIKENNFSSQNLSLYEKLWKERLFREIQSGNSLRELWKKLNDEQIERLFSLVSFLIKFDKPFNFLVKNLKFDWHARVLSSLLKIKNIKEFFEKVEV